MKLNSSYFRNYEKSAIEVSEYLKLYVNPPKQTRIDHEQNTNDLKFYLNSIGCSMPSPKWHYNKDDKKTWKYIDSKLNDSKFVGYIPNPNFSYAQYDKE